MGKRIKDCRKAAQLTLRSAAAKLEISHPHLCNIEHDKMGFSVELLIRICDLYQCSSDFILGLTRIWS